MTVERLNGWHYLKDDIRPFDGDRVILYSRGLISRIGTYNATDDEFLVFYGKESYQVLKNDLIFAWCYLPHECYQLTRPKNDN